MTRYARRKDATHSAIVDALRRAGATVHAIEGPKGTPDLLVGLRGTTFLLEAKAGRGHYNRETNEAQARWAALWRGHPVAVVRTPEEALRAVGLLDGPRHPSPVD